MDNIDFITVSLNLRPSQIKLLNSALNDGILHIYISLNPEESDCPFCGGKIKIHSYSQRTIHHSDICGHPSIIHWKRTRFVCKDCQKTFSEKNVFSPDNFSHSYTVLHTIAKDLKNPDLSYEYIATKNHISVSLVLLYADSFLHIPRLRLPENLGIDEISSDMAKYGGAYLCVMVDNNHRCLTEILPDRSKRSLSKFFESIPLSERSNVRFVTIDMWQPYKDVALKYLPNVTVSVDNFHVVKELCLCFTKFRVQIMNNCVYGSPEYYLLKHWHKLLETDEYDLDYNNPGKYNGFFRMNMNYRDLYNLLLDLNPNLTLAYQLKEKYRIFNRDATEDNCQQLFDDLVKEFTAAQLPCYEEFLTSLKNWRTEILNSFKRPYNEKKQSNALAENMNGRIKTMIGVANGYGNFERFRARALYCFNDRLMYSLTQHIYPRNKREFKPRGKYQKNQTSFTTSELDIIEDDPIFSD